MEYKGVREPVAKSLLIGDGTTQAMAWLSVRDMSQASRRLCDVGSGASTVPTSIVPEQGCRPTRRLTMPALQIRVRVHEKVLGTPRGAGSEPDEDQHPNKPFSFMEQKGLQVQAILECPSRKTPVISRTGSFRNRSFATFGRTYMPMPKLDFERGSRRQVSQPRH